MPRPLRSPDVAELRAFCLAADLGSLGRAAVALRTSQPALADLRPREREFVVFLRRRLLDVVPQPPAPTPTG